MLKFIQKGTVPPAEYTKEIYKDRQFFTGTDELLRICYDRDRHAATNLTFREGYARQGTLVSRKII